jgi:hypothetical protein
MSRNILFLKHGLDKKKWQTWGNFGGSHNMVLDTHCRTGTRKMCQLFRQPPNKCRSSDITINKGSRACATAMRSRDDRSGGEEGLVMFIKKVRIVATIELGTSPFGQDSWWYGEDVTRSG